jgi:hypothetical protein
MPRNSQEKKLSKKCPIATELNHENDDAEHSFLFNIRKHKFAGAVPTAQTQDDHRAL